MRQAKLSKDYHRKPVRLHSEYHSLYRGYERYGDSYYPSQKQIAVKYKSRIELFYLPPYSPELNLDEYLNGDLKSALRHSSPARNQQELESKAKNHLRKLKKRNNHVARFFLYLKICYAA
ncbi:hypothetical protein XNC1_0237 [Xenorhabdus nematophila ATCC 19061]|uniref:Tc1-like transposase DDE domain-containing protein n=1 Tax=Xenorhabdus nematophila (strain ATCC 19061 / DSM 3370 / CCUG 14189 / LMG 1036 / NCIMB 9965 / AN6) TaxID=406817 RepID=D3VH40_XENNA|nr:hypothetical protein XNC1_0237 [Xenorhabdus nematophila ATCC 19061]